MRKLVFVISSPNNIATIFRCQGVHQQLSTERNWVKIYEDGKLEFELSCKSKNYGSIEWDKL